MFRNKLLLVAIVSLLLFVITGCGSKTASTGNNEQKDAESTIGSIDNTKQQTSPNTPDLVGKVKTIEGNKITVYKVNMTNNRPPENTPNSNNPLENTPNGNKPPDESAGAPGPVDNSNQQGPPESREEMFQVTDETYNLVINADAQITRGPGRGTGKDDATQLNLADIKTGNILGLSFGEKLSSGEQSVKSVQLMQ